MSGAFDDCEDMTQTLDKSEHVLKVLIEEELEWAPDVNADRIGVAVNDGGVILSGEVDTYPEKEAAIRAVLRVRTVTAVADEVVVEQSLLSRREDPDIARDASAALERTVVVPTGSVKVIVHKGAATLSGSVPWQFQRAAARRAVATVPGVKSIINSIELEPRVLVSQSQAESRITSAIMRSAQLDAKQIAVAIEGTVVTLTGEVSTWAERRQAENTSWCLPGVTEVVNHLTVSS